ncbi:hypothetical protein [Nocardia alni]|uniref:hypothetical protein n=1 Tax=Nocardia alni TaxID=2815723 RepID=UPI001C24DC99|nr:hypothetical protein [Nocardia alni]
MPQLDPIDLDRALVRDIARPGRAPAGPSCGKHRFAHIARRGLDIPATTGALPTNHRHGFDIPTTTGPLPTNHRRRLDIPTTTGPLPTERRSRGGRRTLIRSGGGHTGRIRIRWPIGLRRNPALREWTGADRSDRVADLGANGRRPW